MGNGDPTSMTRQPRPRQRLRNREPPCHALDILPGCRLMNDLLKRITLDPTICHGKPTVRGLRYPVSTILELLAGNVTPEEILADYPDLERADISACLAFAARLSSVHRILPLAA